MAKVERRQCRLLSQRRLSAKWSSVSQCRALSDGALCRALPSLMAALVRNTARETRFRCRTRADTRHRRDESGLRKVRVPGPGSGARRSEVAALARFGWLVRGSWDLSGSSQCTPWTQRTSVEVHTGAAPPPVDASAGSRVLIYQ